MNLVRSSRAALVLIAIAIGAAVPSVAAARTEVAREPSVGSVQLAGERVAYIGSDARERPFVAAGGTPLFRAERGHTLRLEASPQRLAFAVRDAGAPSSSSRLFAPGLDGSPGDPLSGCVGALLAFDVSGDVVVHACQGPDRNVTVHDLATGAVTEVATGGSIREVEVAGQFVAYERSEREGPADAPRRAEIVVHSLSRGEPEYVVSGDQLGFATVAFDLQADGKIAVAAPGANDLPCSSRLVWYSPDEPFAHEVARDACADQVEMAGDRIAYRRAGGRELAITDLGGSSRLVAAFPVVQGLTTLTGWDYDGARFAWGERQCSDGAVYVGDPEPAAAVGADTARCPVRLLTRRAQMSRSGVVPVRLRCARGCEFDWDLLLFPRRDESVLASGHHRLVPGASVARLRVNRGLRPSLRGLRRTSARLTIRPYDRIGDTQRELVRRIPIRLPR